MDSPGAPSPELGWMLAMRFDRESAVGFADLLLEVGWGFSIERPKVVVALGRVGRELARVEQRPWDGDLGRLRAFDIWLAVLAYLVAPASDAVARRAGIRRVRRFLQGALVQTSA